MLVPLRLNNHAIVIWMAGIFMLFMASDGFCYRGIDDEHTTDRTHGLYEVREEARKFMATQNAINHTNWVVGDPDLRAQLTRCAVPLKVKWAPASYELPGKNVLVYCTKTIKGYSNRTQWNMTIGVTPPLDSFELFFNIRETAVTLLERTHSKQVADFPSTKDYVGKCLEPLEATMNKNKSAVNVTCKKPLQTFFFKGESWTVPVPIQNN